jgi:ferredoxin
MKVRVDAEACSGHGRCYTLAPEVYAPDEYGHCTILLEPVPANLRQQARVGETSCPERAITIDDP